MVDEEHRRSTADGAPRGRGEVEGVTEFVTPHNATRSVTRIGRRRAACIAATSRCAACASATRRPTTVRVEREPARTPTGLLAERLDARARSRRRASRGRGSLQLLSQSKYQ